MPKQLFTIYSGESRVSQMKATKEEIQELVNRGWIKEDRERAGCYLPSRSVPLFSISNFIDLANNEEPFDDTSAKDFVTGRELFGMLHLGNGAKSQKEQRRLLIRLDKALDMLAGLQQMPLTGNPPEEQVEIDKKRAEIENIARDIYAALTGKEAVCATCLTSGDYDVLQEL